jgi:hypothetical protein
MDYDNKKCDACAVNTLSLFDPPSVQTVMNGFKIIKISPNNGNDNVKDATTIEFEFPVISTPEYYDLSDSKLYVNFTTMTTGGLNPKTGTPVPGCYINLPTSSLFSDVRLVIYDKPVESTGNMYHYQSYIHDELQYSKQFKNEVLSISGYVDEQPTKDLTDTIGKETNPGYVKKRALMYGGEKFIGTINLGLFRQELKIPGFVKMKLIFTRAPTDFIIDNYTADKVAKLKVEINKMYIETRMVDVVPSVFNAHIQSLKSQNFMYHINRESTVTKTVASGSIQETISSIFPTSQLPKLFVMAMVRSEAFSGSAALDPFYFEHFDLKYAKLSVNSSSYPNVNPYEPVWGANRGYMREYLTLNTIGAQSDMCGITPLAYTDCRFFLVWNLCPDKLLDGAAEIIRPGLLTLELAFDKSLKQAIHVIMYGVFDNTIEITNDKDVIRNWV